MWIAVYEKKVGEKIALKMYELENMLGAVYSQMSRTQTAYRLVNEMQTEDKQLRYGGPVV